MNAFTRTKRRFRIALAVTMSLAAGIVTTWFCFVWVYCSAHTQVGVGCGTLAILRYSSAVGGSYTWIVGWKSKQTPLVWIAGACFPTWESGGGGYALPSDFTVFFPLWPLLLPSAIIAFRAHRTIRRLAREFCNHC